MCRRVFMSASNTFQRVSSKPMPQVSMDRFGMSTKKFHPNSWGISPVCHVLDYVD